VYAARVPRETNASFVASLVLSLALLGGCNRPTEQHGEQHAPAPAPSGAHDPRLEAVALVHGGAGPWAVAGYRMGEFALAQLGLQRGSFDLEVTHYTPREVQYSCIADGAAAATGASLGKLNLTLSDVPAANTRTSYRRRSTKQVVVLRLTEAFKARFLDVPREKLGAAGKQVLALKDQEIFETVR